MLYMFLAAATAAKAGGSAMSGMAAGAADHVWTLREIAALLD